ncbi:hypothetical protein LDO26_02965 [Luteimonas sp. BDR2-5]|uniref:hypothetical protein n=1 Tax=Proluteimonas luteida TaxID=2878685 RepID=UPI001E2E90DF|nr:hypothetical protein [Luteimonas sp. BDR2-5]MCD9027176.1 hypothetical protein [Luteimonas sp. BDR2-5]
MNDIPATPLSNAELVRQIQDLQARAFEVYEDAALQAEADPARAEAIYRQAEQRAAPLIESARVLNDERVRRLRARARRWRIIALATAVVGGAVLLWLVAARG